MVAVDLETLGARTYKQLTTRDTPMKTTQGQQEANKRAARTLYNVLDDGAEEAVDDRMAEDVFKGVAADDPSCAMAFWGMAMTQLHPLWAPPPDQAIQKGQEAVRESKTREAADLEDSADKHPVTPGAVRPAHELFGDMLMLLEQPEDVIDTYRAAVEVWRLRRIDAIASTGSATPQKGPENRMSQRRPT